MAANNDADYANITGESYSNFIWELGSTNPPAMLVTSSVQPLGAVCTDGSVTGYTCGASVTQENVCSNENDDGTIVKVCDLDVATDSSAVIVQSGDSGGSVLVSPDPSGGTTEYGGLISAQADSGHQVYFTDSRFAFQDPDH